MFFLQHSPHKYIYGLRVRFYVLALYFKSGKSPYNDSASIYRELERFSSCKFLLELSVEFCESVTIWLDTSKSYGSGLPYKIAH